MVVSTRGRYALRVLIDLAERREEGFIPLRDIVSRQGISQKYVENIMSSLSRAGLVEGVHGRGGGYRLTRAPEDYSLGEVLRLTEGDLAPVSCLEGGAAGCERAGQCRTLPVWDRLNEIINAYLDSVALADLLSPAEEKEKEQEEPCTTS